MPVVAPDSREEPLDDPTPRVNGEADLIGVLAHDLDRDQRCRGDLFPGIPAVGEDALDEREDAPRDSQKRPPPSRSWILAGCGSSTRPRPSVSTSAWITSVDLLSSIVSAWPAGLGGLGALAVDDCRRRAGVAPDPFAIRHHECVVYPFKASVVAPDGEPAVNRPPWWQVVRQQPPRAARPHDIEDAR